MGKLFGNKVKISVIMVDGGFREQIFGVEYFSKQDFPPREYEILWVEFYDTAHPQLKNHTQVKVITLDKKGLYHSSYCFNAGIKEARGEILVIPDADVMVEEDFLATVYKEHRKVPGLVMYFHRLMQGQKDFKRHDLTFQNIKQTCNLPISNPENYGGCLTVRKKWLEEIGGYELHRAFASGAHANGKDVYTRLKNLGLCVKWHPNKFLYHPWHPGTGYVWADQKRVAWQLEIVKYRAVNLMTTIFEGENVLSSPRYTVPPSPQGEPDNLNGPKLENKYLFILCPPASGSTLLHKILQTSPHTSAFQMEGQSLVKDILFTKDRWNPQKVIPWSIVKEKWFGNWDRTKPILVEKSPPNLIRAKQLEEHFPRSHFVIMMRNPYAFCEGIKRRWGKTYTYRNIAKFWALCARYQIDNIKNLKHTLWFTYENLTDDPGSVCRKLIDFIPQLEGLSMGKTFDVFEKSLPITDLNQRQISNLTGDDISEINRELKKYPGLLSFFNYRCIEVPEKKVRFKASKGIYWWLRSLNRLPEPIRWQKWEKL